MTPTLILMVLWVALFLTDVPAFAANSAPQFVAFSLREAESQLRGQALREPDRALHGITELIGAVVDTGRDDVILVGQANSQRPTMTLDDLAVALRAVMVHQKNPLVTIEKTDRTEQTGRQDVVFVGGIENTQMGADMLEADLLLKRLALGKVSARVWGVRSYADLFAEANENSTITRRVYSRFWFKNVAPSITFGDSKDVVAILNMQVKIDTEVLAASEGGGAAKSTEGVRDEVGSQFAGKLTMALEDIGLEHRILLRARPIIALVSFAGGAEYLGLKGKLHYWLKEFKIRKVDTPPDCAVLQTTLKVGKTDFQAALSGGVQINPIVVKLQAGDPSALRDLVLSSRPNAKSIAWYPSLQGWQIPGVNPIEGLASAVTTGNEGCSIDAVINIGSMASKSIPIEKGLSPVHMELPKWNISAYQPPVQVPRIGGVMLSGTAQVAGGSSPVSLASGNFSLVVEGDRATCDLRTFQRFVTALWALYYSRTDPGISIDPIRAGGKKHMVRYIGKVINTDLGRVMREADYLMKQWAVGTSRPNVQGFLNPDEISGRRGTLYYGASSRFWFVPEDMRFKEGNGMLLYDSGRMRVRTEFNLQNDRGMKADPSNEQFADFLTEKYQALAQQHPVLNELLDYAKLVQLAKYLKQNHVPLFWFLMANKDLVLTEDSPGTVDALAKGSDYFKNIYIEGGVDMATNGEYVFDQAAVAAINQALSHLPEGIVYKTSLGTAPAYVPGNFSFDLKGQSYSTVPQSSLTSGKDRRGIRYQTDLAVRAEGFELGDQALESLRPEILRREIFHKLGPVTAGMSESERREKFDSLLKKAMEESKGGVDSLLAKLSTLKNKDFAAEAEFADALKRAIGPDAVSRFGDLIVKQARFARNLELVRYLSPQSASGDGEFGAGWHLLIPYRMQPAGPEKRKFLNALVPVKMEVVNLVSGEKEVLTFSEERYSIAGYVPDKAESSQIVGLFLLSDSSYRMADKLGNEFQFGPDGYLKEMVFSKDHRTRIEYGFTETKTQPGYELRPDKSGYESIQNIRLPKAMLLHDFSTGLEEKLVFNKDNPYGIIGYTPKAGSGSKYRFLALMNNGSFALSDTEGNEAYFDPSGKWTSTRFRVVKGFSQGQFRMEFQHDVNSGSSRVAEVRVMRDGRQAPLHVVKYEYGQDQRLAKVVNAATGS